MTITPLRPTGAGLAPTEKDLWPHLGLDNACIYCGCFQTDERAETDRTVAHVVRDLAAVHRVRETLRTQFGIEHPGYDDDIYDLLCELDTAEQTAALAESEVAR